MDLQSDEEHALPMLNTAKTPSLLALLGGLFFVVGGAIGGNRRIVFRLAPRLPFFGRSYCFRARLAIASANPVPAAPVHDSSSPLLILLIHLVDVPGTSVGHLDTIHQKLRHLLLHLGHRCQIGRAHV
mgnify:CR=1 FL=1